MNYDEAKKRAQAEADATGCDRSVTKVYDGYHVSSIPAVQYRFGRDREGEIVHCSDLARCMPGHGPCAKVRA